MKRIARAKAIVSLNQPAKCCPRSGKVLAMFAILLPVILGVLGLVVDGSMLRVQRREAQHAADAAATAAAAALADGKSAAAASSIAVDYVLNENGLSSASVDVEIPPADGPYAGKSGFAEVSVTLPVKTYIMQAVGAAKSNSVRATSVSGSTAATGGAAIVVLDPSPPGISLPAIAGITLPTTPSLSLGGLEVLGVGQLKVNGAVLVDNQWGGKDEDGDPAGVSAGLRNAITCDPVVSLSKLTATDIRVTGGVDNPKNYGNYASGKASPLHANRKPVPDPLSGLPVPSTTVDGTYVSSASKGGVNVITLPLLGSTTLKPGVYDYIQILAGNVVMQSGVYIIRGKHPLTGISLQLTAGQVTANGVMFYITGSSNYSATTGLPDASDTGATPDSLPLTSLPPSVVLNAGLLGSQFTPLSGTGSPYDGILIFQDRSDRRIIVLARDTLLTSGTLNGTIYAKWGHVILAGMGTFDARFVVGSMRFINVLDVSLQPSQLLPPATDVFLVQ